MFHIVHSPRFALLAPLKPTFSTDTSDQRFGYSGQIMNMDSVKLLTNSFGGNRREVGSCGFRIFGNNQSKYLNIHFRQIPLASTVIPA